MKSLFMPNKGFIRGYLFPLFTIILFTCLIVIVFFNYKQSAKHTTGTLIADDVARLSSIFQAIDKECKIIDFEYQKNPINFLNVDTFVGSEVGPMNITHPKRWQGPYLNDNPTMQEKEYMVVRTNQGHFVTPGQGVVLPNGKEIGKDILLDEDADIQAMMQDEQYLMFRGRALAAPLLGIRW